MKRHFIEPRLFGESLVSNVNIDLVLGFKSLLFVCFPLVSFFQTIFIFNFAIDRIIEHGILLDNGWKFLHNIFTVVLGLLSQASLELFLRFSINVTDCNWIKVMGLPVHFSSFCF